MRRIKWLYYTVGVGLVPFVCRIILFLFRVDVDHNYIFNETDIISFSLALQVGTINELADNYAGSDLSKYKNFGASIFFVFCCGMILIVSYIADIDKSNIYNHLSIKICSGILAFASLFFSYRICGTLQPDDSNGK